MKNTLNKNDWLTAEECRAKAWFELREEPSTPDEAGHFRIQQGQEIGVLARQIYPDGVLITPRFGKTVSEVTQELIADPGMKTFFEAGFASGPFGAKADILQREADAWHVMEVKSNFSDTGSIKDLIDDLAYTVMVVRKSGLRVVRASLVLLSRNYRYGDGVNRLFEILDKTAEVDSRVPEFDTNADAIAKALLGDVRPPGVLASVCRDCDSFETKCLGAGVEHTVFEIPALHSKKLQKLAMAGIVDLANIPDDLGLNSKQERAKQSALSGKSIVDSDLKPTLDATQWPCYYLDFETVQTFLPLYTGHGCHRPVLTQFSVHSRDGLNADLRHSEYLAGCHEGL